MIETTTVAGPIIGASAGKASAAICGFTAMTIAAAFFSVSGSGLSRTPRAASAAIGGAGWGSNTAILPGARAGLQPALEQGAAHLAGAAQNDRAGEVAQVAVLFGRRI